MEKPIFKHNCKSCIFLGSLNRPNYNRYDFYYCNPTKGIGSGTLIARYSDIDSEYCSGIGFAKTNPIMALAAIKAIRKGLLSIDELN